VSLFEILKIFIEQTFKLINIDPLLKSRERHRLSSGRVPNSGVGAVGKWPAAATGEGLA
jgi:hypothetical protein